MIGYEYNGFTIAKEDAWQDIKDRCYADLSEKQALEEIVEDFITSDPKILDEIVEAFYDNPAHEIDKYDMSLGEKADYDFEREGGCY